MSLSEIDRFNEAVRNDHEMLKELKTIGTDVEKVIQFANQKGFTFTLEDLKKRQAEGGELSDADMDKVAGGFIAVAAIQGVSVAGVVAVVA